MSADHDRLDALRRLAKDRAATPAEKATARRFAKALAAKLGKRPRQSRRKRPSAALPEPPAARWRRQWIIRLEAVLHKIAVAGKWVHGVWIVSIIGLVFVSAFGGEAVQRQAGDIYLVRTLGLLAVVFTMMAIAGLLYFPNQACARVCNDGRRHRPLGVPGGSPQVAIVARVRDVFGRDIRDLHSLVGMGISRDRARPSAGEPRCAEGRRRARNRGDCICRRRRLGLRVRSVT
jgi:hypothetical protein